MEWKSLSALGINSHVINQTNRYIIISNIPWNPAMFPSRFQTGNWINIKVAHHLAPLMWIYRVTRVLSNSVKTIKFRKIFPNNLIRTVSSQEVTFSLKGYHLIKVLSQDKHGAPFKVVRDLSVLPKSTLIWIFEINLIEGHPWDWGEWHW